MVRPGPVKCRCHPISPSSPSSSPPHLVLAPCKYDFKLGRATDIGPLGELPDRSYPVGFMDGPLLIWVLFQFRNLTSRWGDSAGIMHGASHRSPGINVEFWNTAFFTFQIGKDGGSENRCVPTMSGAFVFLIQKRRQILHPKTKQLILS